MASGYAQAAREARQLQKDLATLYSRSKERGDQDVLDLLQRQVRGDAAALVALRPHLARLRQLRGEVQRREVQRREVQRGEVQVMTRAPALE